LAFAVTTMTVPQRIILLGAYGNTGRRIARLLAPRSDVQLVLAGRSLEKAMRLSDDLAAVAAHPPHATAVDATQPAERRALFNGASLVIAASSTSAHAADIVRDAVHAGADAYDTNLSLPGKTDALAALSAVTERMGRTIITDGGFHPGLPGAMARHALSLVPGLTTMRIGGAFQLNWNAYEFSRSTIGEFVEELALIGPECYDNGRWVRSWSAMRPIDFGAPIGERQCVPWAMQEMREVVAAAPALTTAGFFIAGFGPLIDYLAMPAAVVAYRIAPSQKIRIGGAFLWALRHLTARDEWTVLQLDAMDGARGERVKLRVSHDSGYDLTAFPVVAGVEQLLDRPRRPGVFTQAGFVEPSSFFHRLRALGVSIQVSVT